MSAAQPNKRSRNGCLTCRSYHKRCDETLPICLRCSRLGHDCVWPTHEARPKPRKQASKPAAPVINVANPTSMNIDPQTTVASSAFVPERHTSPGDVDFFTGTISNYSDTTTANLLDLPDTSNNPFEFLLQDTLLNQPSFTFPPLMNTGLSYFDHAQTNASLFTLVSQRTPRNRPKTAQQLSPLFLCHGKMALELLPAAYLLLYGYWLGTDNELLVSFANAMAEYFTRAPEAVRTAAYASGAAYFSAQRWDLPRSITLQKITGDTFAKESGLNELDMKQIGAETKTKFTQLRARAVEMCEELLRENTAPVMNQISALYDIGMIDFIMEGASETNAAMTRIKDLLFRVFPPGSTCCLSDLKGFEQSILIKWIANDIFTGVLVDRRTALHYTSNSVREVSTPQPDKIEVRGMEWFYSCPDELFCALAATSNLGVSLKEDPVSRIDGQLSLVYEGQAAEILSSITSFNPYLAPPLKATPLINASRLAVQELWRQSALIHYYQVIELLPPDSKELQECLDGFLSLLSIIDIGLPAMLYGPLSFLLFIAGTVAITVPQQHALRKRHSLLFEVAGHRDGLRFLESLWSESYAEGKPRNWRLQPMRDNLAYC